MKIEEIFDAFKKGNTAVNQRFSDLSEEELNLVTGGEDEYNTYFTYAYVCPKCHKSHNVNLYYNLSWHPFWNDGCVDLTFWYDVDLDSGGRTGTLVDRRTYERISITLVSGTSSGETIYI